MREKRRPYSLVGIDGNVFSVIGYTMRAMKECGYSNDTLETYKGEVLYGEHNYDEILSMSIEIIDRCNAALGFDNPFLQLMKGHDGLTYVEDRFSGNRIEKLIKENYSAEFNYKDIEDEFDNIEFEQFKYDFDSDYYKLYNCILKAIKDVLNSYLFLVPRRTVNNPYPEIPFTKKQVKEMLLGNGNITDDSFGNIIGIIDDEDFWEYLEEEHEIPTCPINENSYGSKIFFKIQYQIKIKLIKAISLLMDDEENIKFSKYDIYHAFIYMISSNDLFTNLARYVPEG